MRATPHAATALDSATPVKDAYSIPGASLVGFRAGGKWWLSLVANLTAEGFGSPRVVLLAEAVDPGSFASGWVAAGSGRNVFNAMWAELPKQLRDGDLVAARWPYDPVWHVGTADQAEDLFGMIVGDGEIRPLAGIGDEPPRVVRIAKSADPRDWLPERRSK